MVLDELQIHGISLKRIGGGSRLEGLFGLNRSKIYKLNKKSLGGLLYGLGVDPELLIHLDFLRLCHGGYIHKIKPSGLEFPNCSSHIVDFLDVF